MKISWKIVSVFFVALIPFIFIFHAPSRLWTMSKYYNILYSGYCPANYNLEGSFDDVKVSVDNLGKYIGMNLQPYARYSFDGGGGKDTIVYRGGVVLLDGAHFSGIENFKMFHDAAAVLLIPGMATVEGWSATFEVENGRTTFYLDGCMQWGGLLGTQKASDGLPGTREISGVDEKGNRFTLKYKKGSSLYIIPPYEVARIIQ